MKVYTFGNEFLEKDSLAKTIVDEIKVDGIEFVKCDGISDIFLEKDIIILDVVEGINDVILIEDTNQLKKFNIMSLHDFDLGFFLKLMKEMKQLKKVKIIGIPMKGDIESIRRKVISILNPVNPQKMA